MKKCRITAMKQHWHNDLMELYENPIKNHCDMEVGSVFISVDAQKPEGFCSSAWESVYPFVLELAKGGGNFFDGTTYGKYGKTLNYRESIALETQKYPDTPHHAHFPSTLLNPGEKYTHVCVYKFGTK